MRFVEHNEDGSVKWEAHGNFSPLDVHRQVSVTVLLLLFVSYSLVFLRGG